MVQCKYRKIQSHAAIYIWPVTSHDRMQASDKDHSGALDLTEFVSMFDKLFGWTGNVKVCNILGSCML